MRKNAPAFQSARERNMKWRQCYHQQSKESSLADLKPPVKNFTESSNWASIPPPHKSIKQQYDFKECPKTVSSDSRLFYGRSPGIVRRRTASIDPISMWEIGSTDDTICADDTTLAGVETTVPSFPLPQQNFERAKGSIGKGGLCLEYSDSGTGDFRRYLYSILLPPILSLMPLTSHTIPYSPSFELTNASNGSSISPLKYKKHAIYRGKLPMPDCMPSIRNNGASDASTLVVTMVDIPSEIEGGRA